LTLLNNLGDHLTKSQQVYPAPPRTREATLVAGEAEVVGVVFLRPVPVPVIYPVDLESGAPPGI